LQATRSKPVRFHRELERSRQKTTAVAFLCFSSGKVIPGKLSDNSTVKMWIVVFERLPDSVRCGEASIYWWGTAKRYPTSTPPTYLRVCSWYEYTHRVSIQTLPTISYRRYAMRRMNKVDKKQQPVLDPY
jgi:hypothetical protein